MAKAKAPATESSFVDTAQDNDFADPEPEPAPRGIDREEELQAVRESRAAARMVRGRAGKRRKITNYLDAERLRNLGLLTPEEHVDCEEAELFPDPRHYATGTSTQVALNVPPDEGV